MLSLLDSLRCRYDRMCVMCDVSLNSYLVSSAMLLKIAIDVVCERKGECIEQCKVLSMVALRISTCWLDSVLVAPNCYGVDHIVLRSASSRWVC